MKGSVDVGGSGQGPHAETRLESGSEKRDCRPVEHQQESCTLESWLARAVAPAVPRGPASFLWRNILHISAGDKTEPHELCFHLEERAGGDEPSQSARLSVSPLLVLCV